MFGNNLNIIVTGSGCCKQEIFAVQGSLYDIQRFGINFVSTPENADLLVMQGFYNKKGLIRVLDVYERMHQPKGIIAVGNCVLSGNLFDPGSKLMSWFRSRVNVVINVPGCPPRPEAFMYAVLRLLDKK